MSTARLASDPCPPNRFCSPVVFRFCSKADLIVSVKWPPLSRPIFDRNKLRIGGADFKIGAGEAAPAIPALEPALRSHSCVALNFGSCDTASLRLIFQGD